MKCNTCHTAGRFDSPHPRSEGGMHRNEQGKSGDQEAGGTGSAASASSGADGAEEPEEAVTDKLVTLAVLAVLVARMVIRFKRRRSR